MPIRAVLVGRRVTRSAALGARDVVPVISLSSSECFESERFFSGGRSIRDLGRSEELSILINQVMLVLTAVRETSPLS